jgi:hypothetical protein
VPGLAVAGLGDGPEPSHRIAQDLGGGLVLACLLLVPGDCTLRVFLTTWDIGHRISYLDVMLAGHLDRTFAKSTRGLGDAS